MVEGFFLGGGLPVGYRESLDRVKHFPDFRASIELDIFGQVLSRAGSLRLKNS